MGAWFYTAIPTPLIWQPRKYSPGVPSVGPSQFFLAGAAGQAELSMHFERTGSIRVEVFENGAQAATWSKTLTIAPRPLA